MSRVHTLRPGETVPRSGIYQESRSKRRATLVKGEPAPPTPHKQGQWYQVVDTESTTDHLVHPWSAFRGFCVGVFLTRWVGAAQARRDNSARRRPNTPRKLVRGHERRSGYVMAFASGVLLGLLVAPSLGPPKPQPSARRPCRRETTVAGICAGIKRP
jgi:hypothetical protein